MEQPILVEARRVRDRLNLCKGSWPRVAEAAEVSHSWLSQFSRGVIDNPTVDTLAKVGAAVDEVLAEAPKAA